MSHSHSGPHVGWPRLGSFWTIPNALSLARVVLAVPIAALIWMDGPLRWILGLCLVAVATDWFDGRLARWSHTVSDWGKVLDPLADKVSAALIVLALTFRQREPSLPLWFPAFLVSRDVLIVLGGVVAGRYKNKVLMSLWSGKVAVTALAVTVVAAILGADPPVMQFCLWATVTLMTYSFLLYVVRFVTTMRGERDDDPTTPPLADGSSVGSLSDGARSLSG